MKNDFLESAKDAAQEAADSKVGRCFGNAQFTADRVRVPPAWLRAGNLGAW